MIRGTLRVSVLILSFYPDSRDETLSSRLLSLDFDTQTLADNWKNSTCAEVRLMQKIAKALDDGNIDEDEQKEIEEAEAQVQSHLRACMHLHASARNNELRGVCVWSFQTLAPLTPV